MENDPVELVSFPNKNGGSVLGYVNVYYGTPISKNRRIGKSPINGSFSIVM